jgi:DNA modification methylase
VPVEAKSKVGEIYRLGEHILMCGDSTKAEDVRALLDAGGAEHVNLCVTDPPYNVAVENSQGMTIHNDDLGKESFQEFLVAAFKNIDEALYPGSSFYIWYATASALQFLNALEETNMSMRQQLIWVKNAFTIGRQDYQWRHEPCLYGWKDGASHYFVDDRTQSTVWDTINVSDINKMSKAEAIAFIKELVKERDIVASTIIYEDRPQCDDLHPTMKPVPLIGKLIKNSSRKGEDVLDLFGGSGSTMIACEQLNRRCFTMEYDPRYVDAIIDRYEKFTCNKAERIKEAV